MSILTIVDIDFGDAATRTLDMLVTSVHPDATVKVGRLPESETKKAIARLLANILGESGGGTPILEVQSFVIVSEGKDMVDLKVTLTAETWTDRLLGYHKIETGWDLSWQEYWIVELRKSEDVWAAMPNPFSDRSQAEDNANRFRKRGLEARVVPDRW
jgi:hypothetical protein